MPLCSLSRFPCLISDLRVVLNPIRSWSESTEGLWPVWEELLRGGTSMTVGPTDLARSDRTDGHGTGAEDGSVRDRPVDVPGLEPELAPRF